MVGSVLLKKETPLNLTKRILLIDVLQEQMCEEDCVESDLTEIMDDFMQEYFNCEIVDQKYDH